MATKKNALIDDAQAQDRAAGVKPPLMDAKQWDAVTTPEYGGQADIIDLAVGEIGGPFIYIGHQPMNLEGKEVTVHIGQTSPEEGSNNMRLPISASFLRAVDQAKLTPGDKFAIKRNDDVKKKAGVGKGNMMQIFSVKVLEKAASGPTPAAK